MDLVNETGMEAGWLVSKIEPPASSLTVMVKGTFALRPDQPAVLAGEQLPVTGDELEKVDEIELLRYPMDFAPFKPRADLLLFGQAHAPGGKPTGGLQVSFRVGSFKKSLAVLGDRYWLASNQTTEPVPFVAMPLGWNRAFGGADFPANPIGKGLKDLARDDGTRVHPLPNIESLGNLLTSRRQQVEPAGFGPFPEGWPQRKRKFGRTNARYLKERWPGFPENLDWNFFNTAPEDQQLEGYLKGDEEMVFENLHPSIPLFRAQLPNLRVRGFLHELVRAHTEMREVPLVLDTLWVEPDKQRLLLVWRGHVTVPNEKLTGIYHLLLCSEDLTSPMAPLESFRAVLQESLDRREADDDELEVEEPDDEAEEQSAGVAEIPEAAEEAEATDHGAPEEVGDPGSSTSRTDIVEDQGEAEEETGEAGDANEDEPGAPDPDEPLSVEQVRVRLDRGESLDHCDLSGLVLDEVNFGGVSMKEALLERTVLIRSNLVGADLAGAILAGADLREAKAERVILAGADLTGALMTGADLTGADLTAADLSNAKLRGASLARACAIEAIFEGADLSDANVQGANLSAADLCRARLNRTDFREANLTDAALEEAWGRSTNLRGAILHKVRAAGSRLCQGDFREAHAVESVWELAQLYAADFSRAHLDASEFSGAYLGCSIFEASEMKFASFNEANLWNAKVRRANLFGTSLEKASLLEADFTESNLYGATLMDVRSGQTIWSGANLRLIKARETIA